MKEGWTVVEAQADDPIYQQGGVFGIGITHPKPKVSYEPLTPELQIKYNGTLSTLNIIIYKEICIYKHLVAEQEYSRFANACVLDIDASISNEALHQLLLSDDQTKSSLFLIGGEYGVDIFNVKYPEISVEEFKQRCVHLAETLSLQHNVPVRAVFAQTLFPHIINCNPKDNLC